MSLIMIMHVVFGTIAVLAGFFVMLAPKGTALHRQAGKTYVVSMLIMSAAGVLYALALPQAINVLAGALTAYLVLTAWHAGREKQLARGSLEVAATIVSTGIASAALLLGWLARMSETGGLHGFAYQTYWFIAAIALFCSLLDMSVLHRGDVAGKQRLIRHIWRMCFSFFIAAGSLFTGPGAKAFPQVLQDSGLLLVPEPLILLFMLYWVVRTLWRKPTRFNKLPIN